MFLNSLKKEEKWYNVQNKRKNFQIRIIPEKK
jgi:hypothetical protein